MKFTSALTRSSASSVRKRETKRPRKRNALSDGQGRLAFMLLAPTMLVMFLVAGLPTVLTIREAFFRENTQPDPATGIVSEGEKFVGLGNFAHVFGSSQSVLGNFGRMDRFWNDLLNTTTIAVVAVVLETVLGVVMALIMAKAFRGRGIVRASILVPWAIPTIVSALMWKFVFSDGGVMNRIIGEQVLWLADNVSSFWAIIIADVWKTAPFIALLTLAGLQTIPHDVYEAAKVDGASAWQQFWRITLPLIKPTLVVAVLFRTLDTLRMFDLVWGMVGPGKYRVETLSVLVNQEASATRYGSAAAYAMVLVFYVLLVAYLFIRILGADLIGDPDGDRAKKKKRSRRSDGGTSVLVATAATGVTNGGAR